MWGSDRLPDAVDPAFLRKQGLPLINPETALAGLRQALDHDETFVAIADVDWARFVPVFASARPRPLLHTIPEVAAFLAAEDAESAPGSGKSPLAQRLAGLSANEQEEELLSLVTSNLAVVLGHGTDDAASVLPKTPFKDLGVDSLLAVEVRNRLNTATGLRLPATLVYDHPNPLAVAHLLRDELATDTELPSDAPYGSVHTELDRLEAVVNGVGVPESERSTVAARLRALLTGLEESRPEPQEYVDETDNLDQVSDDDMFDLIDQALRGN